MTGRVIFVDDEEHIRLAAKQAFELAALEVQVLPSASDALGLIERDYAGVLVTDIRMPDMDGMAFMHKVLEIDPDLPVVLITGHGDVQLAVEAMRSGAYDFIEKPFASGHLVEVVKRAIDKRRLMLEIRALRSVVERRDELETRLAGRTEIMVALRRRIRAVAQTDADVLIVGATGTGKEVAARALHAIGARANRPFVAINCGALPADLIENELFGHEPGAFAGATRERYGKFEHARGGTVFLDEIESMPMPLQVKLLRVIQERSVTRLGSNDPIDLDVRFVAASKADLEREAAGGRFRSDLLYCLNVVTLRMPTLEQRQEDVPRLFAQLTNEAASRYQRDAPQIPATVFSALANRAWPGNVRELRNAADRFALGLGLDMDAEEALNSESGPLAARVDAFERNVIVAELAAQNGRLNETYKALGLSRKSLYEKMRKHGLNRDDYRIVNPTD
ncbi:MAG: sigma-54-dependent transcriptional regulator [Alphaproteobacteria bacterium]